MLSQAKADPVLPQAAQPTRTLDLHGSAHGVLLLHSLAGGPQELQFVAQGLHQAGYTVQVPVLAGYSLAAAGQPLASQPAWTAAALAAFDALQARCTSVVVGGLSVGAVLALQLAALRAPRVAGVMALSTALRFDGWAVPWRRKLLPLAAWLPGAGQLPVRMTPPYGIRDDGLRAWIASQVDLAGRGAAAPPALRVRDLLQARRLAQQTRRLLPDITAPTLLLHAQHDDVASSRNAQEVGRGIRSQQVTWGLFADSFHLLSLDREKQCVLASMVRFLQQLHGGDVLPPACADHCAGSDGPD